MARTEAAWHEPWIAPTCWPSAVSVILHGTMTEGSPTTAREDLFVPDRFELLAQEGVDLRTIVLPVGDALEVVQERAREMRSSRRGGLMILRGETGSGKSTFLDTVGLFLSGVTTIRIPGSADIAESLNGLPSCDGLRIAVLEGREALRDVPLEILEAGVHAINSFVRDRGSSTLVVWPANTDDLATQLADLARTLGGESLLGTGPAIQLFSGPPSSDFVHIAEQTIGALNEGASLAALGVSEDRAAELARSTTTIGRYLALVRDDLLRNGRHVRSLLAAEKCRVWTLVIAGNDPEGDVAALTRGGFSYADVDRLLTASDANVAKELRGDPASVGILGTMLDARILNMDMVTVLAIARKHGDKTLHDFMRTRNMTVGGGNDADERLKVSELGIILSGQSLGLRKTGRKPGSNTQTAFRGLAEIARTNDIACNRAIGEALLRSGLIKAFEVEKDLGTGLTRRTDLYCQTQGDPVRIEIMWRAETGRADISQYVLAKLRNYGKAIGLL
jgi:hypothetical protein